MTYAEGPGLLEPSTAAWTLLDHEHATTAEVVAHALADHLRARGRRPQAHELEAAADLLERLARADT